jgi:hypothetical protein
MNQIKRDCGDSICITGGAERTPRVEVVRNPEAGLNKGDKTLLISTCDGAIFLSPATMKDIIAWAEE